MFYNHSGQSGLGVRRPVPRIAGLPATDGPTGLRDDAAGPARVVQGTDDGRVDELARQAISDVEEYWEGVYGETFDGQFQ